MHDIKYSPLLERQVKLAEFTLLLNYPHNLRQTLAMRPLADTDCMDFLGGRC